MLGELNFHVQELMPIARSLFGDYSQAYIRAVDFIKSKYPQLNSRTKVNHVNCDTISVAARRGGIKFDPYASDFAERTVEIRDIRLRDCVAVVGYGMEIYLRFAYDGESDTIFLLKDKDSVTERPFYRNSPEIYDNYFYKGAKQSPSYFSIDPPKPKSRKPKKPQPKDRAILI